MVDVGLVLVPSVLAGGVDGLPRSMSSLALLTSGSRLSMPGASMPVWSSGSSAGVTDGSRFHLPPFPPLPCAPFDLLGQSV